MKNWILKGKICVEFSWKIDILKKNLNVEFSWKNWGFEGKLIVKFSKKHRIFERKTQRQVVMKKLSFSEGELSAKFLWDTSSFCMQYSGLNFHDKIEFFKGKLSVKFSWKSQAFERETDCRIFIKNWAFEGTLNV